MVFFFFVTSKIPLVRSRVLLVAAAENVVILHSLTSNRVCFLVASHVDAWKYCIRVFKQHPHGVVFEFECEKQRFHVSKNSVFSNNAWQHVTISRQRYGHDAITYYYYLLRLNRRRTPRVNSALFVIESNAARAPPRTTIKLHTCTHAGTRTNSALMIILYKCIV